MNKRPNHTFVALSEQALMGSPKISSSLISNTCNQHLTPQLHHHCLNSYVTLPFHNQCRESVISSFFISNQPLSPFNNSTECAKKSAAIVLFISPTHVESYSGLESLTKISADKPVYLAFNCRRPIYFSLLIICSRLWLNGLREEKKLFIELCKKKKKIQQQLLDFMEDSNDLSSQSRMHLQWFVCEEVCCNWLVFTCMVNKDKQVITIFICQSIVE